jgi:murein DD-endopeptidase MepM/ murein hydrolase activator NlpD
MDPPFCLVLPNKKRTAISIKRKIFLASCTINLYTILSSALFPYIRPKDLAAGDLYKFEIKDGANTKIISSFTIKKLDPNRLPITYVATRSNLNENNPVFTVTKSAPPVQEENGYIKVIVKNTLFGTFQELEFGNELMQRLMSLFTWRMKMPKNVNKNDVIEILVTKFYAEGKLIGYGRIQSVIYRQETQVFKAYYFNAKNEKIAGYYDDRGFSMEKEFLLSPVALSTATSNQQLRYHPVIKTRIPHNGIDFRGSIGTPFFSIADGEIVEMRFDKNVGNMIRIRHKNGIHSEYFHADSLEANLKLGRRVKRGEVIGRIGRTGTLCTGPHLHLGLYYLNGEKRKYINFDSLRKKLHDMPRLNGVYLAEFTRHIEELDSRVAQLASPSPSDTRPSNQ